MIRCWTVWRAAAVARPRPAAAAVPVVRRVRRARRAVTAPIVLYPTIVCTVVGVGGAGVALFPWREGAEGAASAGGAQAHWREEATGATPRYEFTGGLDSPLPPIQPTQVPEPESLLLLGTALLAMFVGAIRRRGIRDE